MTPTTERDVPSGYQRDWDPEIWNIGNLFRWRPWPFNGWVDVGTVTVRPRQLPDEAYLDAYGVEMPKDLKVFFLKENP